MDVSSQAFKDLTNYPNNNLRKGLCTCTCTRIMCSLCTCTRIICTCTRIMCFYVHVQGSYAHVQGLCVFMYMYKDHVCLCTCTRIICTCTRIMCFYVHVQGSRVFMYIYKDHVYVHVQGSPEHYRPYSNPVLMISNLGNYTNQYLTFTILLHF